jgi:hypothetical protein
MVQSFEQFIKDHKDEIEVLQILCSKPYAAERSLKQVKALANVLEKQMDRRGCRLLRDSDAVEQGCQSSLGQDRGPGHCDSSIVNCAVFRQSPNAIQIATGTIVDATIIHAPSSTKNKSGERDPEICRPARCLRMD